ncbi:hypothetical protein [Tateyamaria sp. SN6-1]|uniref:hypothetical protein n=1 Tax=Tateyamaria sp. SN6-1 TaxID=3092148 RepID=UPI0039F53A33
MVAISDAMIADTATPRAMQLPARTVSGARWLVRGAQRFLGTALMLAVAGLWLHPGATFDQDIALIKLVLSVVMGMGGLALLIGGRPERTVEVELDTRRGELRLVRRHADAASQVVHRCAFADLGHVELAGQMVRLWDADSGLLAEVPLSDPASRSVLLTALRAHGKL